MCFWGSVRVVVWVAVPSGPVRTAGLRRQQSGGYFGSKTGNGVIKTFFRPDNPANYWASEVQKLVDGGGRVTIP